MLPYAFYLLKVILCSGILFGYYRLILRNKVFHHYNRFYLLASVVLSLVLPLVEINIWHNANGPAPQAIKILQVVSSNEYLDDIVISARENNLTAEQVLLIVYIITTLTFLGLFIGMLLRIRHLFIKHRHSIVEEIYFVNTLAKGTPFTFLKYIFWNDHIDPDTAIGRQIFKHELAHVHQKHSHDKLFINVVLIFCWCNPVFWLVRKELNMIHEFVADKIAVEDSDTESFAAMILQATYPQHRFRLTNPFFYSPIKRRLLMLTKNKNPKAGYIGRALVLPLALLVFTAFTFKTKTVKPHFAGTYDGKKLTVVIDAGHGGSDKGAQSLTGNISEKDLALSIVKKIKALNNNANLHIVFTRETDVYQPPQEKAIFTKQQQADLFISIHIDGTSKEQANLASGLKVWVAKNNYANSTNSKLFASAILNEFSKNYKLPVAANPQQREAGIAVLQESPCPSVLIEAGNITNSTDLAFLQSDAAKEIIAGKILAAVEKYAFAKANNEGSTATIGLAHPGTFAAIEIDTVPVIALKNHENALIIIDGTISSQKELKKIKPENIASVNVIKGKEAVDLYGEKGKNGVVLINTKLKEYAFNDVNITIQQDTGIQKAVVSGKITIKGNNDAGAQPLFIINGKVQEAGFDINSIPPNEIQSIDVLKDKTALDKYGQKATYGAIEVITKNDINLKEVPVSKNAQNNKTNTTVTYYNGQEWVSGAYDVKQEPNKLLEVLTDINTIQHEQLQNTIFTKVENEPAFPGGDTAWKNYLVNNLQADMPLQDGWGPGTYKIVLTFIVKADGTITDIKSDNFQGSKTAEHCIGLIRKGPKWKPAVQNGHVVNCYKKQPITFITSKK